jgi:hypothetical protein
MKKIKREGFDLLLIIGGRVLQGVQLLISVRLLTGILGPGEIGRMNLVVSIVS